MTSTITCLALLLGLFAPAGLAQASSTPHITISGVSLAATNCLTFQLMGRGFSAHATAELVALSHLGTNIQPGQVQTDNHGTFSTEATGCIPSNQGSSIQFSVRVRDGATNTPSNTVLLSSHTPPPTGMPTISVSNLSRGTTNCLTFQLLGQGFAHDASVDLSAHNAGWQVNSLQPSRVAADSNGAVRTSGTACSTSTQPTCSAAGSPPPLPGYDLPGFCPQPLTTLFYLIARDEHTGIQTDPYPIMYSLPSTGATPAAFSPLSLSISQETMDTGNCLTFQLLGRGFVPAASVDLLGQDSSGAAVTLTPNRVLTDSTGAFTTGVQACGTITQPGCDPPESGTNACAAAPTADPCPVWEDQLPGFCNDQLLTALFYVTARDEQTGAQTAPYPVIASGQPNPVVATPPFSSLRLSVSHVTLNTSHCLAFSVTGKGFSPRLHADLSAQDESQATVMLTPYRIVTTSKGNFTKKVVACGTWSFAASPGFESWCKPGFWFELFCDQETNQNTHIQIFLVASDEQTGAQTAPYPVTYAGV